MAVEVNLSSATTLHFLKSQALARKMPRFVKSVAKTPSYLKEIVGMKYEMRFNNHNYSQKCLAKNWQREKPEQNIELTNCTMFTGNNNNKRLSDRPTRVSFF